MESTTTAKLDMSTSGKVAIEKAKKLAVIMRNMNEDELKAISRCVSLVDLAPGTVIEMLAVEEQTSEFGAFGMATYDAAGADGVVSRGRLILPNRFLVDIEPEGGLPAVYVYYGKVASTTKKDTAYHDLRRVPSDPMRPYSVHFSTAQHARELRDQPPTELRAQLFTHTLSEVATGSTLILYDLKYVKTVKSQKAPTVAFILSLLDEELEEGCIEMKGRVYLPPRFVCEFREESLRVARYAGLKKGGGSRTYHDLIFSPLAMMTKEAVGGVADPKLLETPKASKRASKTSPQVSADPAPQNISTIVTKRLPKLHRVMPSELRFKEKAARAPSPVTSASEDSGGDDVVFVKATPAPQKKRKNTPQPGVFHESPESPPTVDTDDAKVTQLPIKKRKLQTFPATVTKNPTKTKEEISLEAHDFADELFDKMLPEKRERLLREAADAYLFDYEVDSILGTTDESQQID